MAQANIAANLVLTTFVRTWDDLGRMRTEARAPRAGRPLDRLAALLLVHAAVPPLVLSALVARAGWSLADDGPVGWAGLALVALAALLAAVAAATAAARTVVVARRLAAGDRAGRWWAAAHGAGALLLAAYVWNVAPAPVCWWLAGAGASILTVLAPALVSEVRAAGRRQPGPGYSSVA